jgi:ABC-type uncharacterized transport system substrate-binding protein
MRDADSRRWIQNLLSLAVLACACLATGVAQAHPHVWVTMTTELIYAPDGALTGVRQAWTFDDMFSAFATQGLDAKIKGQFTRAELQPLAQVNVESLNEYGYFTYAKINGKKQKGAFSDPVEYWLDYDPKQTTLTLHFTLPLKSPVKAKQLTIEIYDPEFFVDFGFAEKVPVKLVGAPAECAFSSEKPGDSNFPSTLRLDKSFMTSEANAGMGMNFANKISVTCP